MRSCVCSDSLRLLHFPLSADHLLSYHPALPLAHQLHLPRCVGQIPCALSLMRTLAPLPSTTLIWKNDGADQQRLQISDPHFDKFITPATFACWKIRFKTEVCTCSQLLTEAMIWIKEVEMVESVDDLKSSCSIRGTQGPDFAVLDAKIASALNRIIRNTRFKKKVCLEEQRAQKVDRFLHGRQMAYLINEYFQVTGTTILSIIMSTYLHLFFEMMIFRNSIRNGRQFYYQWHKSHLMTSWKDCTK